MDRSPDAELRGAIEGLYATFAKYPLAAHVGGCPCCVDDADHAEIYAGDLRQLATHNLETFAFKAMTTWGDADDFRHFLPRLLELIVQNPHWMADEAIVNKLDYGKWLTWPADEQEAVAAFFEALWADILSRYPSEPGSGWLRLIARANGDARPYLAMWRIAESLAAARHFADFIETHPIGWPAESPQAADQITAWLRDPMRKEELEQAFFRFGAEDRQAADALAKASETLATI